MHRAVQSARRQPSDRRPACPSRRAHGSTSRRRRARASSRAPPRPRGATCRAALTTNAAHEPANPERRTPCFNAASRPRAGCAREALIADEGRVADHRVVGRCRLVLEKVAHGDGSVEARLAKAGFGVPGRRLENLHAVKPLAPAARRRSDAFQPFGRREKEARLAAGRFEYRVTDGADGPFDEGVCDTRRREEGASRFAEGVRFHSDPPGGSQCVASRPGQGRAEERVTRRHCGTQAAERTLPSKVTPADSFGCRIAMAI